MGYKPSIIGRLLVLTTLFSSLVFSTTSLAFSLSDLFGGSDDEQTAASTANPLTDILSSQLGVSQEQAAGGAGACCHWHQASSVAIRLAS